MMSQRLCWHYDVPTQIQKLSVGRNAPRQIQALAKRRLRRQRSLLPFEVHQMIAHTYVLRQRLPQKRLRHRSLVDHQPQSAWSTNLVRSLSKAMHPHHHLRIDLQHHNPATAQNLSMTATRAMQAWLATNSTPSTITSQPGPPRINLPQTAPAFAQITAASAKYLPHLRRAATLPVPPHPTSAAKHHQHGNTHRPYRTVHRSHPLRPRHPSLRQLSARN